MAQLNSTYVGRDWTSGRDRTYLPLNKAQQSDVDPSVLSNAVLSMMPNWDPINICVGGTRSLRADSERLLPREPREDNDAYNRRVYHSVLPPFLSRLASQAAGLILRKGVNLVGDDYWQEWAEDVGGGTSLNNFARKMLETALLWGHCSALVDFDAAPPPRTLAEQRARKATPYLVNIHPSQIRGWRTRNNNPQDEPTQIRIREVITEPNGRFSEEQIEQIRILEEGHWEVWRREVTGTGQVGSWAIHEQGDVDLQRLPLVTVYGQKEGTLLSVPPLLEVGYLNIAYAQRFCDYMHTVHVGSQPLLTMRGFDPDSDSPMGISVNTAILLPVDGGAEYVQPTTDSFDSQLKCLEALESQISRLGINSLTQQNVTNAAAESKRMDRIDSDSIMALISQDLENAIREMVTIASDYIGIEPPEVFIATDYENNPLDGNSITAMLQLFMQGAVSQETLLRILQDADVLPADLDLEEEITRTRDFINEQNTFLSNEPLARDPDGLNETNDKRAGKGDNLTSQTLPTPMRPGTSPNA